MGFCVDVLKIIEALRFVIYQDLAVTDEKSAEVYRVIKQIENNKGQVLWRRERFWYRTAHNKIPST